jgi:hypothetical protein
MVCKGSEPTDAVGARTAVLQPLPPTADRLRKFAVTLALPSTDRGPVEHPPCHLQRRFPGSDRALQGLPSLRRRAPHLTRIVANLISNPGLMALVEHHSGPKSFARAMRGIEFQIHLA